MIALSKQNDYYYRMNKSAKTKARLIKVFGSLSGLADACGVLPQDVNNWLNRGFPKKSLTLIEKEAKKRDGDITVYDLLAYAPESDSATNAAAAPKKRPNVAA